MNRPGQSLLSRLSFSRPERKNSKPHQGGFAATSLLKLLEKLQTGFLVMRLPDGITRQFGSSSDTLHAEIQILDWSVFKATLSHGDIGFAESYIKGHWDTPDLKAILDLAVCNRALLEKVIYGSWYGSLFYRIKHFLRDNTKSGSRKNIHAHYDLGNAFYTLWLDPTMSYSSAWFANDDKQTLASAQKSKIERILQSLNTKPNSEILEIGCGWGGFMEEAIHAGMNVTGLTLSTEQKRYAEERLKNLGSQNQFEVRLQDYRDCKERYDGIASIEMFEAVGEKHWPEYFQTIAHCLKESGKACIQTIVIADELFARYRNSTDFIQQYVFPGGMLPSRSVFKSYAEKAGLKIESEFAFGLDYAKTLCVWRDSFNGKLQEVRRLGFDEAFIRLWNFYLMYCAAGFAQGSIDVIQFTLSHQPSLQPHEAFH